MEKNIDEIKFLSKIEGILKGQGIPSDYVKMDLDWLKKRRIVWERSNWRIGVVGITSSGKSTLINALCSEDILPKEARPTSGILVSCKKGNERKATIIKKSGKKEYLKGEEFNRKKISRYADEQNNPQNKYQIDEICLEFPEFLIEGGVEIVDSPGLDAFGLEGHEEITLRQLVPSVDIVIYLTTTKANSDKRNLNILNKIAAENKPIIIVQNFIDCIEPEYTTGGRIRRSREEVAQRLKRRVTGILEESKDQKFSKAPVIQLSALWGVEAVQSDDKELWDSSNIAQLLEAVDKSRKILKGDRKHNRLEQLRKQLEDMKERFIADYEEYKGSQVSGQALQKLQEKKEKFKSFCKLEEQSFARLDSLKDNVIKNFKELMGKMRHSSEENRLKSLGKEIKNVARKSQDQFFDIIDRLVEKENQLFKLFNLSLEDKRFSNLDLPSYNEPQIYKKTKTYQVEKKRKKKSGLLGWRKLKRKVTGESDYETYYVDRTKTVVDVRKTRREHKSYCDNFKNAIKKLVDNWERQRVQARKVLSEELQRLEQVKVARKNKPQDIKIIADLIAKIEEIEGKYLNVKSKFGNKELSKKLKPEKNKLNFEEDELTEIKVERKEYQLVSQLIDLAYLKRQIYFNSFINGIFKDTEVETKKDRLVLLGQDRQEIDNFFWRITGYRPKLEDSQDAFIKVPTNSGIKGLLNKFNEILLIDANGNWNLDQLENSFIFFLVDIHQYGLTQKQISEKNYKFILNNNPYSLVLQSINEYSNEGNLGEAYLYYKDLCQFIGKESHKCLVNDNDPFYTALFYIADLFSWQAGIGEEQKAIKTLTENFTELISSSHLEEAGKFFKTISKAN
ncbi:dynamin family protein [Fuchsiella alkaliacetigena]|uniref:dynamin family protein n=1 Tax=Fuchsiella alkaliacetigena TaxID=957042 RepID=UPI00200A8540|nr:dynamin family protein [Fuchsiella alkaliacetigena]MCK8825253.1 dynamin family protein [Fuchsiella alkaliacetigena]